MPMIVLNREDFNSELHPFFWQELCDQLGVGPKADGDPGPDSITLHVFDVDVN